jgi:hypothetical protein
MPPHALAVVPLVDPVAIAIGLIRRGDLCNGGSDLERALHRDPATRYLAAAFRPFVKLAYDVARRDAGESRDLEDDDEDPRPKRRRVRKSKPLSLGATRFRLAVHVLTRLERTALYRKLGISRQNAHRWCSGLASPGRDAALRIEQVLGIPVASWSDTVTGE